MDDKKLKPFYKTGTWYTFSFNPEDKYQYYGNPMRFQKFKDHYYEMLMKLKADYYIVVELSEPRGEFRQRCKGPRLHCHGALKFTNTKHILHFLMFILPTFLSHNTIEIDTIDSGIKWWNYMFKQNLLPYDRKIFTNYADVDENEFTRFVGKK